MADRSAAKAGILTRDPEDSELNEALSSAKTFEVTLAGHNHDQAMRDKELGKIGRWIGGEKNAPMTVASLAILISLAVFGAIHLLIACGQVSEVRVAGIISAADKCLALATLALGYVCGKGGQS